MPDTIGQLERELETAEAQGQSSELFGINVGSEAERGQLAKGIGGALRGGLQAASGALQFEEKQEEAEGSAEKQNQFNELINSGREGIVAYAKEQGLDPTRYGNLANNATDQKGVLGIYKMMQQDIETQGEVAEKARLDEAALTFGKGLSEAEGIERDEDFEPFINRKIQEIGLQPLEIQPKLLSLTKALKEQRDAKKSKAPNVQKTLIAQLDLTRKEAKQFDARIKNAKIVQNAANGVNVAVSRAFDRRDKGLDPNFAAVDQALGINVQKVLDPPSVVRESEFSRIGLTQPVLDAMKGFFQKFNEGGIGLTNKGRAIMTEFINDMNEIQSRVIRKEMMTVAVRSGFGERFDPQEVDATMFTPENVQKMKDMHEGKTKSQDAALDARIMANVQKFINDPDSILVEKGKEEGQIESGIKVAPKSGGTKIGRFTVEEVEG